MNTANTVTTQLLLLASFLSVTWGIYLIYTIRQYRASTRMATRGRIVRDFRRMVVAMCLWLFVFSFVFRTVMVLLGLGADEIGQIVFYGLAGSNILGSLFVVASLFFDDD